MIHVPFEGLAVVIRGQKPAPFFFERFPDRYSEGFDPEKDLQRIGVVNQTTMLATETAAIAVLLRQAMIDRYGEAALLDHFADTSDTLCYATNENQTATQALIETGADLAIVVGGYNSSNTTHLVELCEAHMPTYFVESADALDSPVQLHHFNLHTKRIEMATEWLPEKKPVAITLTAGASCPDALLDEVMRKVVGWYPDARSEEAAIHAFQNQLTP
jgi:4-hydroxy-3-methylbut-2-enyl diphosphate reductase